MSYCESDIRRLIDGLDLHRGTVGGCTRTVISLCQETRFDYSIHRGGFAGSEDQKQVPASSAKLNIEQEK